MMKKELDVGPLLGEQMGSAPTVSVTCPPGFAPGAAFVVQDPSTGQQMQVEVPDGITPGQTFQVQVPSSYPAPVPMAQPYVEQQYAPQPQQYAPQPVAPQQVNMMMQPPPPAPIIINNNNINTMQMQAPMPQQMDTHEPSTGWQSDLFDCCNDIPVCFGVLCCFPCAYGMLVDMHLENKAEGHMPFGNFGACCTVYSLQAVGPVAYNIAATVIPFFVAAPTNVVAATAATAATAAVVSGLVVVPAYCAIWCITSRNRTSIRNKLNLKAEPCDDLIVHFFCPLCAVCQECRELKATHGGSMGGSHFNRL